MIATGQTTENKYAKTLQHGINGLREFNFDVHPDGGGPGTAYLTVNANLTVDLPKNYINYVRLGILDVNGNFSALGYNGDIRYSAPVDNCGNPILPVVPSSFQIEQNGISPIFLGALWNWDGIADNFKSGELIGRFFGLGGGNNPNGYYRVNEKTWQIELAGVAAPSIYLEYIADLSAIDGEFNVHPYLVSALKRFIRYEEIEMNDRISDGVKERARQEKYNEYFRAKNRFNAVRIDEFQSFFRKENKSSVRF